MGSSTSFGQAGSARFVAPEGPVQALWYDGQSAEGRQVRVFYSPSLLALSLCPPAADGDGQALAVWPLADIRSLAPFHADKAARLRLEPDQGQRLVVTEKAEVECLGRWLEPGLRARTRRTRRRWVAGALAVWIFCCALYAASPLIFSGLAGIIPQAWEEALGKSARDTMVDLLGRFEGIQGVNTSATKDPAVGDLLRRLEQAIPGPYRFDVLVVDANFANAFAMPGGYLTITTGLVVECRTPDELAGVLAHEMAHVTRRHGTSRMLRDYVWGSLLQTVAGSQSVSSGLAQLLVSTAFERDDEREADRLGALRAAQAGINPLALGDFFARQAAKEQDKSGGLAAYISTHPQNPERTKTITDIAAGVKERAYTPALPENDWQRLRRLCEKALLDKLIVK